MDKIKYIYIDWGTTNCRVYALDNNYRVIEEYSYSDYGVLNIRRRENYINFYNKYVKKLRGDDIEVSIYISGMAGSYPYGWITAPQISIPITLSDLVNNIVRVPDVENVYIISGLKKEQDGETVDLIRGEEIQAIGANSLLDYKDLIVCLPGTHSKWLFFVNNKIVNFATSMTGELFSILSKYSILSALLKNDQRDKEIDDFYFYKGLKEISVKDNLLNVLFKVRASFVDNNVMNDKMVLSYLSGILIGYEILKVIENYSEVKLHKIALVSDIYLGRCYRLALDFYELNYVWLDSKVVGVRGLQELLSINE